MLRPVSDRELDHLAAEYVLGTLDISVRRDFADALDRDPDLGGRVTSWEHRLAQLDIGGAEVAPSGALWDRLDAALDAGLDAGLDPAGRARTIRSSDGEWQVRSAGVEKKTLLRDEEKRVESYLLRIAPGTRIPAHGHDKIEECVVMEGDLWIGDLHMTAGDFHTVPPGYQHAEAYTETGALVFIRGEIREAA